MATLKTIKQIVLPEGYVTHRKSTVSASIADHSTRALVGSAINIEGIQGKVYTLCGIEIVCKSTATTVVNNGGKFELENDAVDWKPFESYPNVSSFMGANAGAPMTPTYIAVNKPLPAGSNVSVYYTAINAATDSVSVTLIWSTKEFSGAQTFIKAGVGTALTQTTIASAHVTCAIPANKGGLGLGFMFQSYGTIETIVVSGGKVGVRNDSCNPALTPCDIYTGGYTGIGTGGAEVPLQKEDALFDAPANSTFSFDYTPTDNQSQYLAAMVVWEV